MSKCKTVQDENKIGSLSIRKKSEGKLIEKRGVKAASQKPERAKKR